MPSRICYLDGQYLPLEQARISPLDRGFLFGDAVYEVMPVYGGRPFRFEAHCERLTRSLAQIRMADPLSRAEWRAVIGTLISRNGGGDQYVYWQVTRGAEADRSAAPLPDIARTIFAFSAPLPRPGPELMDEGISCISADDSRWMRCDIKATALLAGVLLRQLAVDAGARETILLRDGELTEGSSSAVHVVIDGQVRTPPLSARLLPGTTREVVEELADKAGIPRCSAPVTQAQLRTAEEIWVSSAIREVQPVTRLDGHPVGSGRPGPLWRRIHTEFQRYKRELAGQPW